MTARWSDPSLLRGPSVALVMTQDEFDAVLKEKGIDDPDCEFLPDNCRAVTSTYRVDGELVAIVSVHPDALLGDPIDVASTLCHEAVHVWQRFAQTTSLSSVRECWGSEAEAYAIQNIVRELMTSFAQRIPS